MLAQLPLNIQLRDDATFASFYPGKNVEPLKAIQNLSKGQGEKYCYLWGKESCGRSHLLQAACHAVRNIGLAAIYLPLKEMEFFSPQTILGLENVALVCIDDVQMLAKNDLFEEAIFHLYNRIQAQDTRLLISGESSPKNLPIKLADLKSRLAFGITYQLHTLDDEQKLEALSLRAHCRGLELNKLVGQFLLSRCPRNMTELFQTLEQLDRASLAEQRRLTIPFVKQILGM